ncbi:MAG: type II secretion system minor pseudopilin GspH [Gammaproteobacteria bacterium]|nr:type II secretion system minor pseudopilin GspH [Gammaproteobacteria bacterium]NNF61836.1 type II secretion system minor pseudopilin GspH [Gammaproteobacteria bacterium]
MTVVRRARGFTLLELMVVIVIVGVLVSLAVMSLGDNAARRLEEEATRFGSLLRLAADEAVLQGRDIGVVIDESSYSFHVIDDQFGQWQPMAADRLFRQRNMIEGIRLELAIDDISLELPPPATEPDDEDLQDTEPVNPQVLLLSSGEITPFELLFEFVDIDRRLLLRVSGTGEIDLLSGDAI